MADVVRTEETVAGTVVVVTVTLTSSLQPNQPGVAQLVVVYVVVTTGVLDVVVVVSSRHPHHPGVLHVVVRVLVFVVVVVEVVVLSEPLLSKYFQLKQSTHSSSGTHSATSGYFLITLSMTL